MKHQRDAFITELFQRARENRDIFLLSADFGAPALDQFREQLPEQFIHCGISEQNMIDLAAGLALDGRQVFCYAMAPFVSLRCLEQHKCATALMSLPVCTIVAGVGLGYADAGPTHYATEDLACLRAIVNSTVLTASDAEVARLFAVDAIERPRFSFVRLDRQPGEDYSPQATIADVRRGFRTLGQGRNLAVVTHGFMLGATLAAIGDAHADEVTVVDLLQVKPVPETLVEHLAAHRAILTIEEQTPSGGLSAAVMEALADRGVVRPFHRLTLPERYFFENGGRAKLLELARLSPRHIALKIAEILAAQAAPLEARVA